MQPVLFAHQFFSSTTKRLDKKKLFPSWLLLMLLLNLFLVALPGNIARADTLPLSSNFQIYVNGFFLGFAPNLDDEAPLTFNLVGFNNQIIISEINATIDGTKYQVGKGINLKGESGSHILTISVTDQQNNIYEGSLTFQTVSREEILPVRPILNCVQDAGNGEYFAFFDIQNDNGFPVTVPVGSNNKVTPSPQDRGQQLRIFPGLTQFYPFAYSSFVFDKNEQVKWTLMGNTGVADKDSTPCPTYFHFGSDPNALWKFTHLTIIDNYKVDLSGYTSPYFDIPPGADSVSIRIIDTPDWDISNGGFITVYTEPGCGIASFPIGVQGGRFGGLRLNGCSWSDKENFTKMRVTINSDNPIKIGLELFFLVKVQG